MTIILGGLFGIALAILLYAMVSRGDRHYYQRRQEIIAQRLARLEEAQAQREQDDNPVDQNSGNENEKK